MAGPNEVNTTGIEELEEGFGEHDKALSLDLDEERVKRIIGDRISKSQDFWNEKLNLDEVRKDNQKRWMNRNLEVSKSGSLYKFQVPYRDNRIFLSVETLVAALAAQLPEPVIVEARDADASRELAQDYQNVLKHKTDILRVKNQLQMALRHLLMGYRIGILKVFWDFDAGSRNIDGEMSGDVKVKAVRPQRVVFDRGAEDKDDLPLVAEKISSTIEELAIRFPKKKDKLLKAAGIDKTEKERFGRRVNYWEVYFDYYNNDGNKSEAIAWKLKDLLLDKGKNPLYDYENPSNNFFQRPQKPYILINYLSIGRWIFDDTSLTEQAADLQDVLEKRGRQIVENADQANSTKVFNTQMIKAQTAQKYTGDPRESIMVKGDVRKAFKREAPPLLPSYVFKDKLDARAEIDNIFGTHAPIRGERSDAPTLGQEVISQRSDLGRLKPLVDTVDDAGERVYKWMTQLYKVFGDESHFIPYAGGVGKTTFIEFKGDKIEDGIQVKVQTGSSLPNDKITDKNEAIELAKLGGRIDPLTFAERWHLRDPRSFAKRLFFYLYAPDRYLNEILEVDMGSEEDQQEARATIQKINSGEYVPPKDEAGKQYVAAYNQFIRSPAFKQLDPEIQNMHIQHIQGTIERTRESLEGGPKPAVDVTKESPEGTEEEGGLRNAIGNILRGGQ